MGADGSVFGRAERSAGGARWRRHRAAYVADHGRREGGDSPAGAAGITRGRDRGDAGDAAIAEESDQRADKEGVKIDNGDARVEIRESEIINGGTDSMGASFYAGIQLTDGELTVARSRIQGNVGGGVAIFPGKKFSITSSFIVENRGNGGISAPSPAPDSQLEFNTIADNQDAGDGVMGCRWRFLRSARLHRTQQHHFSEHQ